MATGAPLPVREFANAAEMQAHYAAVRSRCFAPRQVAAKPAAPVLRFAELRGLVWSAPIASEIVRVTTAGQSAGHDLSGASVIQLVMALSGLTRAEIVSEQRGYQIARARHLATWLMSRYAGLSTPQIGALIGHRDHTTVLYGKRRVELIIERLGLVLPEEPQAQAQVLWDAEWPRSVLGRDRRPC